MARLWTTNLSKIARRPSSLRRLTLAALALAALAGCSNSDAGSGPECPKVGVVTDAARQTQYREGPGRDLTDVVFEASLGAISGECAYAGDRRKVTVKMKLPVTAARGPADAGGPIDARWFVAIVDPDRAVIARQEFTTRIEVPPNQAGARVAEELEQTIPLKSGQVGSAFQVLVGLALTPDQLERNRAAAKVAGQ